MKKFLLVCLLLPLTFCKTKNTIETTVNNNEESFNNYKQNFILALWKINPAWASSVGFHNYDSILIVPGETQRKTEIAFYNAQLDSLKVFDLNKLSEYNKIDYFLISDFLKSAKWSIEELKSYQWDPSNYNVCGGFSEILSNNYDSLDERLRVFNKRLKNVSPFYEAAKKNIISPTKEHTELAIMQNLGGVSVFENDLETYLKVSTLQEDEKRQLRMRAKTAVLAVKNYVSWLKKLENANPTSFRLGKELYTKKFEHDIQSNYSADEIFEKALSHKKNLHSKMFTITKQLWPNYSDKKMPVDSLLAIRELIDILSQRHVEPDSFQTTIEKQIPELVAFINRKQLIYLDPSKPLVVRKEPAYMAGMAGASISSPGPYDINGNTYYNVGSMKGWSKEKSESYLREYNHYILQILNIHEAIPGHYTQLIYSNKSAAQQSSSDTNSKLKYPGIIKSILGNGAMIEGWAVYTELMMLENGYGATKDSVEVDPEMWLMYYKWNLRSTCNTILDYSVHVKNISREDALTFLTKEAFQQQAEAEGKWRRATLSQVQLCSYFTGFTEILSLREDMKARMGDKFNLKQFHETFLSYGSAPVKYIRMLMLAEDQKN